MNDEIRLMEIAKDLTIAIAGLKGFDVDRPNTIKNAQEQVLGVFKTCLKTLIEDPIAKTQPETQS